MGPEPALSTIDRGCELEAGSSRLYCLERAPQDTACMSASAGRVACIARAACTSLDQNSNK